jgi:hypothetical protein
MPPRPRVRIKVGDRVQLRTGGPVMIVQQVLYIGVPAGPAVTDEMLEMWGEIEATGYYPTELAKTLKLAYASFMHPQVTV